MLETSPAPKKKKAAAPPPSAWEQALRWLDARWYSQARLTARLREKGYPDGEIARVMNDLRRYNLVNDAALATEFAKSESQRGRGARRIRMELARHGLSGEAAKNALAAIAPGEEESARTALAGKLRSWAKEPDWRKRREKAFRFLAGRGYTLEVVRRVLEAEPSLQYGFDETSGEDCAASFEASLGDGFEPEEE